MEDLGSRNVLIVRNCSGGFSSCRAVSHVQGLIAAIYCYCSQIAQNAQEQPKIPVQMHFGAQDHSIPTSAIQTIKDAQKEVAIYVYEPAGHGFGCPPPRLSRGVLQTGSGTYTSLLCRTSALAIHA